MRRRLQPGRGVGLEAPHQQAADLLLEVDVAVRIAHDRQVAEHALDPVGDDVVVLAGKQRNRHAEFEPEGARPLAAAQHYGLGGDRTGLPLLVAPAQPGDSLARAADLMDGPVDANAFDNPHAGVACALG
jgi:hypothetical protein